MFSSTRVTVPRVWRGVGMRARAIVRTGRVKPACRPGDDDIPGGRCSWLAGAVARSTKRLGERSAGPLVWLWMPGDLVASHLAWRRDAEFHSCASAAAPISCEGVCFMLMAARSCSDARCGFSCPDSWPNGEIAPGASRRLRRVGAVVGNCASPTRAHVTRPCHFNGCLPPASSFQLLHSRRNWDRN